MKYNSEHPGCPLCFNDGLESMATKKIKSVNQQPLLLCPDSLWITSGRTKHWAAGVCGICKEPQTRNKVCVCRREPEKLRASVCREEGMPISRGKLAVTLSLLPHWLYFPVHNGLIWNARCIKKRPFFKPSAVYWSGVNWWSHEGVLALLLIHVDQHGLNEKIENSSPVSAAIWCVWVCVCICASLSRGSGGLYLRFNYPHETVGKMSAWNKLHRALMEMVSPRRWGWLVQRNSWKRQVECGSINNTTMSLIFHPVTCKKLVVWLLIRACSTHTQTLSLHFTFFSTFL